MARRTLLFFFLLILPVEGELDLPSYAEKKVEKAIEKVWPDKKTEIHRMEVPRKAFQEEGLKKGVTELYELRNSGSRLGYLIHGKAPSRSRHFDYAILQDTELKVQKIRVLIYRESHGGEIGSKRWLKQFEGKGPDDPLRFRKEIDGISGATISARSMTRTVRKVENAMAELKKEGALNSDASP